MALSKSWGTHHDNSPSATVEEFKEAEELVRRIAEIFRPAVAPVAASIRYFTQDAVVQERADAETAVQEFARDWINSVHEDVRHRKEEGMATSLDAGSFDEQLRLPPPTRGSIGATDYFTHDLGQHRWVAMMVLRNVRASLDGDLEKLLVPLRALLKVAS